MLQTYKWWFRIFDYSCPNGMSHSNNYLLKSNSNIVILIDHAEQSSTDTWEIYVMQTKYNSFPLPPPPHLCPPLDTDTEILKTGFYPVFWILRIPYQFKVQYIPKFSKWCVWIRWRRSFFWSMFSNMLQIWTVQRSDNKWEYVLRVAHFRRRKRGWKRKLFS